MKTSSFVILVVTTLSQVIGQIFLKKGSGQLKLDISSPLTTFQSAFSNMWIYAWIVCAGISVITWIYLVGRFPINWAYPVVMTAGYVLLLVFSSLFLGERISANLIAGVILMTAGIIVASTGLPG